LPSTSSLGVRRKYARLNALYHALRMAEAEIKSGNTVEVCSESAYSINGIRSLAPN
jgi:hypothetical protein